MKTNKGLSTITIVMRTVNFLTIGLISLGALDNMAATECVGGVEWTYFLSPKGAVVGSGSWFVSAVNSKTKGNLTVPLTLGGQPVVSIGDGAFYNCTELTKVTIPSSVVELGTQSFYHCDNLVSLVFLGDEPKVGYSCFTYATNVAFFRTVESNWPMKDPGSWMKKEVRSVNGLCEQCEIVSCLKTDGRDGWFAVPHSFMESTQGVLEIANGDYSVALNIVGKNGYRIVDSYVAGLNPDNSESKFMSKIEMVNGNPEVSWSPNRSDRVYRVLGSSDLKTWREVGSGEEGAFRFFRVSVEMP